ncbi:MAG TPA: hypothetical protein VJZ26_00970 [Blastocatellia bacterium]|nr:hypothetical protein [Blastocatellia bacterium]
MSRKFIRLPFCVRVTAERRTLLAVAITLAIAVLIVTTDARAQDPIPPPPLPVDPTPLAQLLTASERAMLADASNPKKSVEVYLKLSDAHLEAATEAVKNGDAGKAERELDIYTKILAEATKVISSMQDGKRSSSKKMEQVLYKQIRSLETIERLFPAERIAFAEDAIKKAKQFRVQALNQAFAGGDVLKDPDTDKPPTSDTLEKDDSPASDRPPPLPITARRAIISRFAAATRISTQIPGDYLTEEEDEHVREAQKPEDRIKVFIKIADRRLQALTAAPVAAPDAKAQKKLEEEVKQWGVLPKLSRTELLRHYTRAIDEGMAKLEDAYERNPKSSSIPKALNALLDATERHLQTLQSLGSEMKDERESAALKDAIEQAQAANKGARDGLKGK